MIGIKTTGSVYNPDRKDKKFHIVAKVSLDVEYTSGKKKKQTKMNKEVFSESRIITAKTLTEAKNIHSSLTETSYHTRKYFFQLIPQKA